MEQQQKEIIEMIYEIKKSASFNSKVLDKDDYFYRNSDSFKKLDKGDIVYFVDKENNKILQTILEEKEIDNFNCEYVKDGNKDKTKINYGDIFENKEIEGNWSQNKFSKLKIEKKKNNNIDFSGWKSLGSAQYTYYEKGLKDNNYIRKNFIDSNLEQEKSGQNGNDKTSKQTKKEKNYNQNDKIKLFASYLINKHGYYPFQLHQSENILYVNNCNKHKGIFNGIINIFNEMINNGNQDIISNYSCLEFRFFDKNTNNKQVKENDILQNIFLLTIGTFGKNLRELLKNNKDSIKYDDYVINGNLLYLTLDIESLDTYSDFETIQLSQYINSKKKGKNNENEEVDINFHTGIPKNKFDEEKIKNNLSIITIILISLVILLGIIDFSFDYFGMRFDIMEPKYYLISIIILLLFPFYSEISILGISVKRDNKLVSGEKKDKEDK